MTGLKSAVRSLTPRARRSPTPRGNAGYDNPRENIDPQIKTQFLATKELSGHTLVVHDIYASGVISGAIASGSNYVLKAGDTMTGTLSGTGVYMTGNVNAARVQASITTASESYSVKDGATTIGVLYHNSNNMVLENQVNGADINILPTNGIVNLGTNGAATTFTATVLIGTTVTATTKLIAANYDITERANLLIHFENRDAGELAGLEISAKDGDGSDHVLCNIFGVGSPSTQMTNIEYMQFGWSTTNDTFHVRAIKGGSGTQRPLVLAADSSANHIYIKPTSGEVGIGTNTPTTELSVYEKIGMTSVGGLVVKLTNKSGVGSTPGNVVIASTTTNDAVSGAAAGELQAIGVYLDPAIGDGSEAWVVVSGIADVHMDAGGCTAGDRIVTSATAGRGTVNNSPAVAVHFQEIGHAVETVGANGTARCVLHFL